MNCKNSAQNALKVAIFRLKIENFSGEGANTPIGEGDTPSPNLTPSAPRYSRLRRSTTRRLDPHALAPSALDLGPRLQILDPPLHIAVHVFVT